MTATKFLIAGSAVALLHFGAAAAQTPPQEPVAEGSQQGTTFESLDKDGDGRISKTEAEADAKVTEQFSMYDKNANGFIEKDEVMSSNSPPETSPPETPTPETPKQ